MTEASLLDTGTVLIVATVLAYVARLVRQPMILGYILAGFIIGPALGGIVSATDTILLLSELGVAFLLFIVGLEIDLKKIKASGPRTILIALGQMALTGAAGYALAAMLGLSGTAAFYVAAALTFSSTVILIKLLRDKGAIDTTHGRLILGILLVQDAVAILILALLPTLGNTGIGVIGTSLFYGAVMVAAAMAASMLLVPRIMNFSARSTELLFLSSVSWLFLFAFLAYFLGYSIVIGAFLAGVALASSTYRTELVSRIKPLGNFFATIFFVSLGMQLAVPSLGQFLVIALAFAAFAVLLKPLIVTALSLLAGYSNKTSILTGMSLGQISEFSLIIIALGLSSGVITSEMSSAVIAAAAISITTTTYVVNYDSAICRAIQKFFRLKNAPSRKLPPGKKHQIILLGCSKIGHSIYRKIKELGKSYVVVDFDPDVVRRLKREKAPAVYGDAGDVEFLKTLNLPEAELVISTIPDMSDNRLIMDEARKGKATVIATSNNVENSLELYDYGASYVILPHFIGGEHAAMLLEKFDEIPTLAHHKFAHIRELHSRKSKGG